MRGRTHWVRALPNRKRRWVNLHLKRIFKSAPGNNGTIKRDHLTGVAMATRKKAKKAAKKTSRKTSGKPAAKKAAPAPAKKAANGPLKKFAAAVKKAAKRIGIGGR